ncbi:MAG: hypothetical protein AAFY64_08250 [Pseudomonadota bacterium]
MSKKRRSVEPKLIIEAGWQSTKIRVLSIALMAGGLVGLYYTPWVFTSLSDQHGNLESFEARLMLSALLGAVSLISVLGMLYYHSFYVARIERRGDTVTIYSQGLIFRRPFDVPVRAFRSSRAYSGYLKIPRQVTVNTPFRTLTLDGWWLPFMIDDQSRHMDGAALMRLFRESDKIRRREGREPSTN